MSNINNEAYETLKTYIKSNPDNVYVSGLYAWHVKVNRDRIRFYRGNIEKPVEAYRYTENNLCKWKVYEAADRTILKLWLARNNHPVLSSGPQEGEEHQITHTYLIFDKNKLEK